MQGVDQEEIRQFFYHKGAQVTGLDLSQNLIKIAIRKNNEISFVVGNFLKLPFKNESFDGIWAHAALVHLESVTDVKKALSEFHRTLKNKGVINIYVRESSDGKEFEIVKDKTVNNERYFRYFSMDEMIRYLNESGFNIKVATRRQSKRRLGLNWLSIFAEKL